MKVMNFHILIVKSVFKWTTFESASRIDTKQNDTRHPISNKRNNSYKIYYYYWLYNVYM